MFDKVVVAIDGSDASARVIQAACNLAQKADTPLTVVHVPHSETMVLAAGALAGMNAAMAMPSSEQIEAAGREVLDRATVLANGYGCSDVRAVLRAGEPADTIVEVAEEAGADLIVTGRRGLGGLGSLVLGSTSQRIGHLAKCSCLTVG